MLTQLKTETHKLYDIDYNLWVLRTIEQLKNEDFNHLDLENLIAEVEHLSTRDRQKLKSLLKRLFEHLLKLKYWETETERNKNHWQREILNFRQQIQEELEDSPSLKSYLKEVFDECYQKGKKLASKASSLPVNTFPEKLIANLEEVLDEDWFL